MNRRPTPLQAVREALTSVILVQSGVREVVTSSGFVVVVTAALPSRFSVQGGAGEFGCPAVWAVPAVDRTDHRLAYASDPPASDVGLAGAGAWEERILLICFVSFVLCFSAYACGSWTLQKIASYCLLQNFKIYMWLCIFASLGMFVFRA